MSKKLLKKILTDRSIRSNVNVEKIALSNAASTLSWTAPI